MTNATVEQRVEADLARIVAKARKFLTETYKNSDEKEDEHDLRVDTFGLICAFDWENSDGDNLADMGIVFETKSTPAQIGLMRMATIRLEQQRM